MYVRKKKESTGYPQDKSHMIRQLQELLDYFRITGDNCGSKAHLFKVIKLELMSTKSISSALKLHNSE